METPTWTIVGKPQKLILHIPITIPKRRTQPPIWGTNLVSKGGWVLQPVDCPYSGIGPKMREKFMLKWCIHVDSWINLHPFISIWIKSQPIVIINSFNRDMKFWALLLQIIPLSLSLPQSIIHFQGWCVNFPGKIQLKEKKHASSYKYV